MGEPAPDRSLPHPSTDWLSLLAAHLALRAVTAHRPSRALVAARLARSQLAGGAQLPPPIVAGLAGVLRASLRRPPQALLFRLVGHAVTLALVVLALLPGPRPSPAPAAPAPLRPALDPSAPAAVLAAGGRDVRGEPILAVAGLPSPAAYEYHTPLVGETLAQIAGRYGVSVASLFWANRLDEAEFLAAGRELRVPRLSGVPYVIGTGDTLDSIAAQHGVSREALLLFGPNRLSDAGDLPIGREIFVPGAQRGYPAAVLERFGGEGGIEGLAAVPAGAVREVETNLRGGPGRAYPRVALLDAGALVLPVARHADWVKVDVEGAGSGWVRVDLLALDEPAFLALPETNDFPPPPPRWVWPAYGQLTSRFGWRSAPVRGFHNGIDIAGRSGAAIYAARAGEVTVAGWCRGYGYCVRIDHGDGVVTIYGHLRGRPSVGAGDVVEAGDRIGAMGMTFDRAGGGYATGVHLHFTVLVNGRAVNPLHLLP